MAATTLPPIPFRRSELADLGLTPAGLRRLVDRGELHRLVRGVYVRADVELTMLVRAHAVALAIDPEHVACDRTAAWIHGIDTFTVDDLEGSPPIETCSLPGKHPTERAQAEGHSRDLEPADIMTVDGLRLTTPLRTAIDLACVLRRREAYAALNAFARQHQLTAQQMLAEVGRRYRRRRGVVQARALIPLVEPRVESQRESWTLLEIIEAGLPVPEPQVWIEIGGVPTYRLDLAYRRKKVAIEYDGEDWHDRTDDQRRYDESRRAWLRDHGWTVIVLRRGDFTGTAVDRWTGRISAALEPTYSNKRW